MPLPQVHIGFAFNQGVELQLAGLQEFSDCLAVETAQEQDADLEVILDERQEGVDAGVSVLVGADKDKIIELSSKILSQPKRNTRLTVSNPYGDGKASDRITDIINNYFSK